MQDEVLSQRLQLLWVEVSFQACDQVIIHTGIVHQAHWWYGLLQRCDVQWGQGIRERSNGGQLLIHRSQLGIHYQEGLQLALLLGREVAFQPIEQPGFVVGMVDAFRQSTRSS